MNLEIILTKGLPGSGKSTWARQMLNDHPGKYKRVNKDEIRKMLDDSRWSKANEKMVVSVRDRIVEYSILHGYSVIIDDTNFHPSHELRMNEIAIDFCKIRDGHDTVTVIIKDFTDVPIEECIKRDLSRLESVGEKVIRGMYNQYLRPQAQKPSYILGIPDAIICDIDGTIALLNGRNPYDASACEQDLVNIPVDNLLYMAKGKKIIFVSGREDCFRDATVRWLHDNIGISNYSLYMRETGDSRKDAVIKEEIYKEKIEGKYNVLFVLDDRNQTVEKWRELGLPCFQVAEGNF